MYLHRTTTPNDMDPLNPALCELRKSMLGNISLSENIHILE